jgi:O-antigen/teichoic acid export membrane protein
VLTALLGDDPLRPAVLIMIPAVHLFHVTCGLAGLVPLRGRLDPRALARPALRFLLVEAIVFAFVGVAALLPDTPIPASIEIAALAGLVVVAVLIMVWHRQTFRQHRDHSHTRDNSHTGGGGR